MEFAWLRNFKLDDFRCHCEACAHDPDRPHTTDAVMRATQTLRDRLGKPLRLTRGVACEAHNKAVGGAGDSRHLPQHADAIDIAVKTSLEAYDIIQVAMSVPLFTAFRVYLDHVHLDARPGVRMFLASPE